MADIEAGEPQAKRRKVIENSAGQKATTTSITSVKGLRKALAFQDGLPAETRAGIQSFKEFLQSVGSSEEPSRIQQFAILRTYCEEQTPKKSGHNVPFYDLLASWNSAVESGNEPLLSAIPAVLALLLKTISNQLEFSECGTALCKGLLQKDQLRLFDRGLTAMKTKEHLISPCIRLLTEIVSFDAGATAGLLYARRETTFKRIDQFLQQKRDVTEHSNKRPTLRRIAQRYIIANLKYQTMNAKGDLIMQGSVLKAFLQGIKGDQSDIVLDMLQVMEQNIVKDKLLTRAHKHRFLTLANLGAIASLYSFGDESSLQATDSVHKQAHALLLMVCTSEEDGILRRQTGWYPYGSSPESRTVDGNSDDYIDLGLDSIFASKNTNENNSVKNTSLSAFVQNLRPEQNTLQMEILLRIFEAAPELVADYFSKRTLFPTDPKPTSQWLGFSAFVFSTIQLPVPENCGWKNEIPIMPPPIKTVIESILPRPLDRSTVTRCLNMNHEVITLFSLRALSAAFRKLSQTLAVWRKAPESCRSLWKQASAQLKDTFAQRCPLMKDVIAAYNRTSKSDQGLHEAVVEVLALSFRYLPDVAMAARFDVSLALVDVLSRLEGTSQDEDERRTLRTQLANLLQIAQTSSDTKWWNKPEDLEFSPFTSLLRVVIQSDSDIEVESQMQNLLLEICLEHGLVDGKGSLNALIAALTDPDGKPVDKTIFQALDQCIGRLVRRPVQYLDFIAKISRNDLHGTISLLAAVLTEQHGFMTTQIGQRLFLEWLRQLFANLDSIGEDVKLIEDFRQYIMKSISDTKEHASAKKILYGRAKKWTDTQGFESEEQQDVQMGEVEDEMSPRDILMKAFPQNSDESGHESSIRKWEKQDVEEVIATGTLAGLMKCLGSTENDIRRQAFLGLQRFTYKLQGSEIPGWQAIYVLLGEIVETTKSIGLDERSPTIVVELAVQCLEVLTQPLHRMFAKVNKFLNKAPVWNIPKLSSYWVEQILMQEPEYDDGYLEEASWLLTLLVSSIQTDGDLELYRKAKIFERVLSWSFLPGLPDRLIRKVMELVYRAGQVDGNNTLVTRMGMLNWLDVKGARRGKEYQNVAGALKEMVTGRLVEDDFSKWSGTPVDSLLL